jgi:Arc/MetJ family transcription regulator
MRSRVAVDGDLLARAKACTGIEEEHVLVQEALKALIDREGRRRLALLGGSEPGIEDIPRRRAQPF